jgi:hypothetical protein
MKQSRMARWVTVMSVVTAMVVGSLSAQLATADIVGTDTLIQQQNGTLTRDELQTLIASDEVKQQLIDYGISPGQATERVAALTNSELQHLSQYMDEEPAGGLVEVLLLILILILVLR